MGRRKTRKRPVLLISSVTVLTLALLAGAIFFLLPKVTAASTTQSTGTVGQINNTANTTNTKGNAGNIGKVAIQPTRTVAVAPQKNSPATGNGNTTKPAATGNNNPAATAPANNGAKTTAAPAATSPQNLTVPVVTLKQYVPNIRHMVAQSFNITDKALVLDLQSGMHLTTIATQQGLSNAQLQTLLSSSIATSFQPAISTGSLTQAQVSSFIQQTQQNPTTLEQQLSILPPPVAHW